MALITYVRAGVTHEEIIEAIMTDARLRALVTREIIDHLADDISHSSVSRRQARQLIAALGEIDAVRPVVPAEPRKGASASPPPTKRQRVAEADRAARELEFIEHSRQAQS
jgi:hypothetical protein